MAVSWALSSNVSLTIWDIEREFQNASEAYEQWQTRHRCKRSTWVWCGIRSQDDTLAKALKLGHLVHKVIEAGKASFGSRFDEGDSSCQTILSAQLLRLQYEIRIPLYGKALSPTPTSIPYDEMITAAKSIRRTCLTALTEQYTRFQSPLSIPFLPPPCFKLIFCPFAQQLKEDLDKTGSSALRTKKLLPKHRHDDREICPHCDRCISVTPYSGLQDYRCILFTSHIAQDTRKSDNRASFACTSCHKTFDDSYAFLDHVFQKQIGSEKSCLGGLTSQWVVSKEISQTNPDLTKQCEKGFMERERTWTRLQVKEVDQIT